MACVDACFIHAVGLCAGSRGVQPSKMKVWLWQKQVIWRGLCNTVIKRCHPGIVSALSCCGPTFEVMHQNEFLMCQHVSGPLVLSS